MKHIINRNGIRLTYTDSYIEKGKPDFINSLDWNIIETDLIPDIDFIYNFWNGSEWIENATEEEIIEANKPIVPENISAMRLKLQLFDLGITDQDIFDSIDSIPDNIFSLPDKEKAKIKYKTSTIFDRNNEELNLVATMKGLSQEDLDNIFINGNNN